MQSSPLFEATDFFRPFPDAEEVFGADVELHAQYLLPLASLDLSYISPYFEGTVHFIQSIEPHDGVVGEGGEKHFNHLCRKNWVGYSYDGGKCQLATDFQFFLLAQLKDANPAAKKRRTIDSLNEHYAKVRRGFELRRAHFHEHGALHNAWSKKRNGSYRTDDRVELVNSLGGPGYGGNWSEMNNFPLIRNNFIDTNGEEWETATPQTEDGHDFTFIGKLSANHYVAENPDFTSLLGCRLLLFYDPVSKVALTTFDWS